MSKFSEAVAPFLTLANAKAWEASSEKYTFVVYNILDMADVNTTDSRVDIVEARFEKLLASDAALIDVNSVCHPMHY